jgi:hypothetical protein
MEKSPRRCACLDRYPAHSAQRGVSMQRLANENPIAAIRAHCRKNKTVVQLAYDRLNRKANVDSLDDPQLSARQGYVRVSSVSHRERKDHATRRIRSCIERLRYRPLRTPHPPSIIPSTHTHGACTSRRPLGTRNRRAMNLSIPFRLSSGTSPGRRTDPGA